MSTVAIYRPPHTRRKPSVVARRAAQLAAQSQADGSLSQSEFPRIVVAQINPSTDARPFLRKVRQTLDGDLLHYTDRMRLLADADRMGIARFEANLLIATVQHRARTEPMQSVTPPPAAIETKEPRSSRFARIFVLTSVLLTAEFLAVRLVIHAITGT